jgi:LmbE family N-acetylglucosaminyl deacetylase
VRSRLLHLLAAIVLLPAALWAQQSPPAVSEVLAQDKGAQGLATVLRQLHTTGQLLHTTAHPDDEDGAMLVAEARGRGVKTTLLTLTRGEGGQNRLGATFFGALGALRTLELLAADNYYGVEQRFTRLADFGFSKTAESSLARWGGKEAALADMVRVIRAQRPDVIVSRFTGGAPDGHGHHQACGQLTREAFRAAADPQRFPEQLAEGLRPWQAKKLYIELPEGSHDAASVTLDVSRQDPLLGMSARDYARQGLRHQLSQGTDAGAIPQAPAFSRFALAESVLPGGREAEGDNFFTGIDTSLPGLAGRLGAEEANVPWLRPALEEAAADIDRAETLSHSAPERAVEPLLLAARVLMQVRGAVNNANISLAAAGELNERLRTKTEQLYRAASLAAGFEFEAVLERNSREAAAGIVVPSDVFRVTVRLRSSGALPVELRGVEPFSQNGIRWRVEPLPRAAGDGPEIVARLRVTVPHDAEYTRPVLQRDDPVRDAVYKVARGADPSQPLPALPLLFRLRYAVNNLEGVLESPAVERYISSNGQRSERAVAVAPAVSVSFDQPVRVATLNRLQPVEVYVRVRANGEGVSNATVQLRAPLDWDVEPDAQGVELKGRGDEHVYKFYLLHREFKSGEVSLQASVRFDGEDYAQGVIPVSRPDLGTNYIYSPSSQRLAALDIKIPDGHQVGYLMGAGDTIPQVLEDLGVNIREITPAELATGNLSRYTTIVLGVRAYDVRPDLRQYNERLLEFMAKGGTLVVQHSTDIDGFNAASFTPYPMVLSRQRITDAAAPVEIEEPDVDVLNFPNPISGKDFEGWVQERGLCFPRQWDPRYTALLSMHDPDEEELEGGLLQASYGKGIYIYSSLSFFRQLPEGVPGAVRLFVNMLFGPSSWKR